MFDKNIKIDEIYISINIFKIYKIFYAFAELVFEYLYS
jgi:hypothetical protein